MTRSKAERNKTYVRIIALAVAFVMTLSVALAVILNQ